jgi:hypothetical protein
MKTYLIILIAFCTLFTKVYGQSAYPAIDSLMKYKVITLKDQPVIIDEFKYKYMQNVSDQVVILGGLETIMLRKVFHVDPHKTNLFYSFSYDHLEPKKQDSVNVSLRQLLDKINKAGLLTNRVYSNTLEEIDSSHYVDQMQMIPHLVEMSSRLEWMIAAKLLPLAQELHNEGIVSDSSFLRLKDDINYGKIESSFQLNDYLQLDQTFDLTKYPKDSLTWIEPYLHKIASILPNLIFSNFSYLIVPDTTFDLKIKGDTRIKIKVSITCNGRVYKYAIPSERIKGEDGKIHYIGIVDEYMYRIFNKILADQQSPYCLHNIHFYHSGKEDDERNYFAVIALKDTQAIALMEPSFLSYMLVSFENYNNTITSAKIDSTIAEWKKTGVFTHLSETEINRGIDDAETADWFSAGSVTALLGNFPKVICQLQPISFVMPRYPCADFLNRLAPITHGAFNPTKITERKIKNGVKLQYLVNGRYHTFTFDNSMWWLDAKTSDFLKNLGRENDLPGDFYILSGGYEVIFLTKQQHASAMAYKLLDFTKL